MIADARSNSIMVSASKPNMAIVQQLIKEMDRSDVMDFGTARIFKLENADALKVSTEIGAFADVSASSPPYAEALTRQKVVNVGAPYISRDYFTRMRPYSWSQLTDCSTVVETVGSYYLAKVAGKIDQSIAKLKGVAKKVETAAKAVEIAVKILELGAKLALL